MMVRWLLKSSYVPMLQLDKVFGTTGAARALIACDW